MTGKLKRTGVYLILLSAALLIVYYVLGESFHYMALGQVIVVVSWISVAYGIGCYAKGKGHSWNWAFLGILHIFGFLILLMFPSRQATANQRVLHPSKIRCAACGSIDTPALGRTFTGANLKYRCATCGFEGWGPHSYINIGCLVYIVVAVLVGLVRDPAALAIGAFLFIALVYGLTKYNKGVLQQKAEQYRTKTKTTAASTERNDKPVGGTGGINSSDS